MCNFAGFMVHGFLNGKKEEKAAAMPPAATTNTMYDLMHYSNNVASHSVKK